MDDPIFLRGGALYIWYIKYKLEYDIKYLNILIEFILRNLD